MATGVHRAKQLQGLRMAIDIGGTFTDVALMDGCNSICASTKILTSHDNPATAALEGARQALQQAGAELADVRSFIHGTTLATNALIEKRGAVVATITTDGFRDILDIAYERRYSQYDINLQKTDFLVPRSRAFTITERLSVNGDVLIKFDTSQLESIAESITGCAAESIAICLLHSYANPVHEEQLGEALSILCPGIAVSLSSRVSPEAREFDRLCTTVANAYIQPLMVDYLKSLEQLFQCAGLTCPILVMTAGGGMTTLETARQFPIRLVESGPAGGAILAATTASQHKLDRVLSFDMGGTTAKLCLIDNAVPQQSRQFEIARAERFIKGSGMPVRIPVVDMIEIGAGGGSIASVDDLGRLQIGPESAGSEPGPVAFGRGGELATVTDADVTLGYIQATGFAEGRFQIDVDAAARAIDSQLDNSFGTDRRIKAAGISAMVDENMASAARMHAVESGKDLGERVMIAFGGNGPLHACRVARAAGVKEILIPPDPGVGSAVGFLYAPVSYELVQSLYTLLGSLDTAKVNTLLHRMADTAVSVVQLGTDEPLLLQRSAFMRYHGQGHEIEIELPHNDLSGNDIEQLTGSFEQAYSKQFSRPVPGMAIEVVNWSVRVSDSQLQSGKTVSATAALPSMKVANRSRKSARQSDIENRSVSIFCDVTATEREARVFDRSDLTEDQVIDGPSLITESQTTTLVAADFRARIDAAGNILMQRRT